MNRPSDNSPEKANFEPHPINMDQARFIDLIEPEYEEVWDDFVIRSRVESEAGLLNLMLDMYDDESVPEVFRDRAMLEVIGQYHYISTPWGPMFRFPESDFRERTSGSPGKAEGYYGWLTDILSYSNETKVNLLSGSEIYREVKYLFNNSLISAGQLEALLSCADPEQISPKTRSYIDDWDGNLRGRKLDPNRLLLLSDILDPRNREADKKTPLEGTPLERWALKQLNLWVQAQTDADTDLPAWMADVGEEQVVDVYNQLIGRLQRAKKTGEDFLSWKHLKPAIECFGWKDLDLDIADFRSIESGLDTEAAMSFLAYYLGQRRQMYRLESKKKLEEAQGSYDDMDERDLWRLSTDINVLKEKELSVLVQIVDRAGGGGISSTLDISDILHDIAEEIGLFQKKTRLEALRQEKDKEDRAENSKKRAEALSKDPEYQAKQQIKEEEMIELEGVMEEMREV